MRFDILTLFPGFFAGPLDHGILSRAIANGLVEVATHDLRSFTHDRHRTVDDRPFGGGEGMVLKPEPIFECVESLGIQPKSSRPSASLREAIILLSAQGKRFTQVTARRLAALDRVVLICGRYEGVDERVGTLLCDEELSIGDYVLSGGELAAAVAVDAIARLLPGVLGHADSSRYESFGEGDSRDDAKTEDGVPRSTHGAGGLLDYPHYTRPAEFRGVAIPEVLAGGDHMAIRRWRRQAALEKTLRNRPDLLEHAALSHEDREFLAGIGFYSG
jgi:tRNA (guanine37-N1)-methyltransferase